MRHLAPALALMALAGAMAAPSHAERRRPLPPGLGTANPSALVATEIAFARMAREKGQWAAFREFADEDAVLFKPEPVAAREWLRGRKDPAQTMQWQAQKVWMSCDGTLGVTQGAWQQPDGQAGSFTTIWKRQKKGTYRWVLDKGMVTPAPLPVSDMLSASVADCPRGGGSFSEQTIIVEQARQAGPPGSGHSNDGTLTWSYAAAPGSARKLVISLRKNGEMQPVVSLDVPGPKE